MTSWLSVRAINSYSPFSGVDWWLKVRSTLPFGFRGTGGSKHSALKIPRKSTLQWTKTRNVNTPQK